MVSAGHILEMGVVCSWFSANKNEYVNPEPTLLHYFAERMLIINTCKVYLFIMVALCNRADHYIFALWFLSIFFLFFLA